jgi:D-sedoheptulose 7-phosphate isomerase
MSFVVNSLLKSRAMVNALLENNESNFASATTPQPLTELVKASEACVDSLRNGGKIFFMGNGGSAAEAQHLSAELVGHFMQQSKPYAALALNTDTSAITAIGNDYDFKDIFARQLQALGRAGDIAIYLSTSGRSENILQAMRVGKMIGITNIAFTGQVTRYMQEWADYYIAIPSTCTPQIQEGHLMLGHILCDYIESKLESTTLNDNF